MDEQVLAGVLQECKADFDRNCGDKTAREWLIDALPREVGVDANDAPRIADEILKGVSTYRESKSRTMTPLDATGLLLAGVSEKDVKKMQNDTRLIAAQIVHDIEESKEEGDAV